MKAPVFDNFKLSSQVQTKKQIKSDKSFLRQKGLTLKEINGLSLDKRREIVA